jgi:hypothetical protein
MTMMDKENEKNEDHKPVQSIKAQQQQMICLANMFLSFCVCLLFRFILLFFLKDEKEEKKRGSHGDV